MYWVWYSYSHFHKKCALSYLYTDKNRVLLKKGCFIGPQINDFGWERGAFFFFFTSKIREKGVFFKLKLGQEHGIRFGRECVRVCVCCHLPTVLAHLQAQRWKKVRHFLTFWYLEFSNVFYLSYWNQSPRTCAYHFTLLSWWLHGMGTLSELFALCAGINRSPVGSPGQ